MKGMTEKFKVFDREKIITKYEGLKLIYEEKEKQIERIIQEQYTLLLRTIDKLQPELVWLIQRNYYFIHPGFGNYKSRKGPILRVSEDARYMYVYDVKKAELVKLDMHDDFKECLANAHEVVGNDYFMHSMEGVLYTRELLSEYNNRINTILVNLEDQLKNYHDIVNNL